MRSYNPEKTISILPEDLVRSYFEEDIFAPDAFLNLKKDLFDYFANKPEAKKQLRTHWILNVHASWNFLNQLDPDDLLNYGIEQIPEAIRLGFDVAEKLVWYMSVNLRNPKLMTLFYSQLRNAFYSSGASLGLADDQLKLSNLVDQVRLLNSYAGDTMRAAELYDKLQRIIFANTENDAISGYIMVDKNEAVRNLVNLANFFLQIEPENIWEAVNAYTFSELTGTPAESVPAPVAERILDPEDAPELTAEEKAKLASLPPSSETMQANIEKTDDAIALAKPQTITEKKIETKINANITSGNMPVETKPTYSQIRDKVDSAFPKDKNGAYKDLDGVLMALEKAAVKYNDPKIGELYYFDEIAGNFKWNT